MDQNKLMETCASWASIGGIVGFAITILLFGIGGGPGGAQGILLGALKGFVGGGLGAAIFYCLAGVIFSRDFAAKVGNLAVVVLLSLGALFLVNKYSPKFNELVGNTSDLTAAAVAPNTTIAPIQPKKTPEYIVVIVSPPLRMGTNSIFGLGTEEELISAARELSDHDPNFEVIISPVNIDKFAVTEAINIFKAAGIKNVREISNEDYLRMDKRQ